MIALDNYSKKNTYIIINSDGYSVTDSKNMELVENGEGGFSEDDEFLGIFVENNKFFFLYNEKKYETNPDEMSCTNERLNNGMRNFKVKIKDKTVCDILYKPYISPLALPFGDDEDEYDYLLYLSKLLHDKNSIQNFITGMNNLKKFYS